MEVYRTVKEIQGFLKGIDSVGFVATMGALHQGHLSLIETSKEENELTVCSIFVNPKQFNREEDLINYPRDLNADIKMLEEVECDVLFIPSVEEMYPSKAVAKEFYFGHLSEIMEGKHRPGHFNGVAIVIERFFEIICPTVAYFGEKDFQQLAVIRALVHQLKLPVKVVGCPIYRESNGLAMSSRNKRLLEKERDLAKIIYETLTFVKNNFKNYSVQEIKEVFVKKISSQRELNLEYFEIVDGDTFLPVNDWSSTKFCIAFTAVYIRTVRLIDNMTIIN